MAKKKGKTKQKQLVVASKIGVWRDIEHATGYQRALKSGHVMNIAGNFDPDKFGLLHVSKRSNGSHWILDGQHRLAALKELGKSYFESQVECIVYTGLSLQEEAKIYGGLNTFVTPKPLNRFRANELAGAEEESAVQKIAIKNGFRITANDVRGKLSCPSVCLNLYALSPKALGESLEVSSLVWKQEPVPPGPVIWGLGLLFHRYDGAIDKKRLCDLLLTKAANPKLLVGKAKLTKDIYGGNLATNVADAIISIYNTKLSKTRLPYFKDKR